MLEKADLRKPGVCVLGRTCQRMAHRRKTKERTSRAARDLIWGTEWVVVPDLACK